MIFSANNAFRPFSAWSSFYELEGGDDWTRDFLVAHAPDRPTWPSLLIRLAASIESIFAIVFFFLFALAVRRRFQMN